MDLQWRVLTALMEADDGDAVRAYLDTLPPEEDDRARARARMRYASGDANLRLDGTFGHTFTDPGDWSSWTLGMSWRAAAPLWIGFRSEWERRDFPAGVRLIDTTLALPTTALISDELYVAVEPAYTPDTDFAPHVRLTLQLFHDPIPLLGYSVGYRYALYTATEAHTVWPTVSLHLWPFTLEPTLVATFTSDGQTSLTGRAKLVWHVSDRGQIEAWGFVGTEPIEPYLALTVDPPVQVGGLFGVAQDVTPLSRVRFMYSYSAPLEDEERAGVNARHSLVVHWIQKLRIRPRRTRELDEREHGQPFETQVAPAPPRDPSAGPRPTRYTERAVVRNAQNEPGEASMRGTQ